MNSNDFPPILPPDTPEDVYPVPYERRRISRVFDLASNVRRSLRKAGVKTLGDMDLFLDRGHDLADLDGIGPKTKEQILDTYESLQTTRQILEDAL